jgi:hypothetical protein
VTTEYPDILLAEDDPNDVEPTLEALIGERPACDEAKP